MEAREIKLLSIAEVADLLGLKQRTLERLVRENDVCLLHGTWGKGGQLRIDPYDLPLIEAVYKLKELRVPGPAMKTLSIQASEMLRKKPKCNVLLAYQKSESKAVSAPNDAEIRRVIEAGAAVVLIDAGRYGELSKRLQAVDPPRRRGRPRLDASYIEEKLQESSRLGDDTIEVESELRRLNGN